MLHPKIKRDIDARASEVFWSNFQSLDPALGGMEAGRIAAIAARLVRAALLRQARGERSVSDRTREQGLAATGNPVRVLASMCSPDDPSGCLVEDASRA